MGWGWYGSARSSGQTELNRCIYVPFTGTGRVRESTLSRSPSPGNRTIVDVCRLQHPRTPENRACSLQLPGNRSPIFPRADRVLSLFFLPFSSLLPPAPVRCALCTVALRDQACAGFQRVFDKQEALIFFSPRPTRCLPTLPPTLFTLFFTSLF